MAIITNIIKKDKKLTKYFFNFLFFTKKIKKIKKTLANNNFMY